jgi:hypothetical protein
MYFVLTYDNRRMKPVEIALRGEERRENNGGVKLKIYCNHM